MKGTILSVHYNFSMHPGKYVRTFSVLSVSLW